MSAKTVRIGSAVFLLVSLLLLGPWGAAETQSRPPAQRIEPAALDEVPIWINELLALPAAGEHEWVELVYGGGQMVYLPVVLRNYDVAAAAMGGGTAVESALVAESGPAAESGPVDISGWQVVDKGGHVYTIPEALPPITTGDYVLILFDGLGVTENDYDLSDRVATLHSPPEMVDVLDDDADQVALYRGGARSAATLHDFVAYGAPPGTGADDAVGAGQWNADWWVSLDLGSGAVEEGAALPAGRAIGVYPGHDNTSPDDWAVYEGEDRTPGEANVLPRAYWSTTSDGQVMGSDAFALGWALVPGATYRLQVDDDAAFGSPLVDEVLSQPFYVPDGPMPTGDYWWRVQAIDGEGHASAWSEPLQVGVVAVPESTAAGVGLQQVTLTNMTWLRQRKDTQLLCHDGCREGNPSDPSPKETWDAVHPDAIHTHGRNNCVRASIAMIVTNYGGDLSQDRLAYQLFENAGSPIEDRWSGVGLNDPAHDLGHDTPTFVCGGDGSNGGTLLAWALGISKSDYTYSYSKPTFAQVQGWINAGRPVMRFFNGHQTVIGGYRELADGTDQVRLFDPWTAETWTNYDTLSITCHYVPPAAASVSARSDEPSIWSDADGDGIMDWDEQHRFPSSPNDPDSDDDWVADKQDMREYVFANDGSYNLRDADWDSDGLRKEVDPDNDGGGTVDGCEDVDYDGKRDAGETNNFSPGDDAACVPAFEIRSPLSGAPAQVGDKGAPDKLMVRVLAAVPPAAGTVTYGTSDFNVQIGGDGADILVPPYRVGDEYWLIVQPPAKGTAGLYDLRVTLLGTQMDTEAGAVEYLDEPRGPIDEVLVVDNSGSMGEYDKMVSAKNAARAFVDRWKDQDMVGLVTFSTTVAAPFPMTTVTVPGTLNNARAAINAMPDTPPMSWLTAIGGGLLEGKKQLAAGDPAHGQSIVLLSDGMENVDPEWSDPGSGVQAAFTGCSFKVHTVAIGPSEASWRWLLQDIADTACAGDGEAWHTSGGGTSPTAVGLQAAAFPSELGNRLADIYLSIAELDARDQRLWEATGNASREGETFSVDVPAGLPEAIWTLNWAEGTVELRLFDPDGKPVDAAYPSTVHLQDATHEQFRIGTPAKGTWRVEIWNTDKTAFPEYLAVLSAHSDVNMWLLFGLPPAERTVGVDMPVNVALADYKPVAGAVVSVTIRSPNQELDSVLQLYDDGKHKDGEADDGLYGNIYPLQMAGSYTVKAIAEGRSNEGEPFTRYATRSFYVRPRLAYVYNGADPTDVATSYGYEGLLEDNGYVVDRIEMGDLATASLDGVAYVIIGPGVNSLGSGALEALRYRAVLGLGEGGYDFFGQLGLEIGRPHGWHGNETSVYAVDPSAAVWNDPYPIRIPRSRIVQLYEHTAHVGINLPTPEAMPVTLIGREPYNEAHYVIVEQNQYPRQILWGFGGPPEDMTEAGRQLFVNVAWYLK
jgi:hypothetical protein